MNMTSNKPGKFHCPHAEDLAQRNLPPLFQTRREQPFDLTLIEIVVYISLNSLARSSKILQNV